MRTFRVAYVDMTVGGVFKRRYLLLAALCGYCGCVFLGSLEADFGTAGEAGLGDLLAFVLCGTAPGIRLLQQNEYQVSYMWLAILMLQLLLPLDYPASSMENWGYPYVMRSSRREWWLAKCLYTLAVDLVGVMLELAAFAACCLAFGRGLSLGCHRELAEAIFGSAAGGFEGALSARQGFYLFVAAPVLGIVSMSMVLLLLSVVFGRVAAYLLGAGWIAASLFVNHPLLPANCTMAIRSSLVDAGGMPPTVQAASCMGVALAAVALGVPAVRRKDFFRMEVEE